MAAARPARQGRIDAVTETPADVPDDEQDAGHPPRPLTFAALGIALGACLAWWGAALTGYFGYAATRSDTVAASGCTPPDCPSQRDALLTFGFFGLLPTAAVGVLTSLVVLVFTARSVRNPWVLGTVSALGGMVLAAAGVLAVMTADSPG